MDRCGEPGEGIRSRGPAPHRARIDRLVGARAAARTVVSAVLLALAGAGWVHAATVEEVVARQLAWLKKTDTYLAEIRTSGLHTGRLGTVFVDNTVSPAQVWFQGEAEFPNKVTRTVEIAGTERDASAIVAGREATWGLAQAPFGKSFALFERGMTVEEAMARLRKATVDMTVVENPAGGVTGLRMIANPGFLTTMDGLLDSMLLGGTLPRGVETTLWFNGEGRLERMTLAEAGRDQLVTTLHYLDTNMPATRARKYRRSIEAVTAAGATRAPGAKAAEIYPSFLEMLLAIKQDDAAKAAESEKGK